MSTSSILTTIQLDRSLFRDDPEGALAACSLSGGLDLGLECPSKEQTHKKYKNNGWLRALMFRGKNVAVFIIIKEKKHFLCWGKFFTHTLNCLCRGVLGWLGTLCLWPWEARGLRSPLVLLQQFSSPLGLSLHGSTVAFPVSTPISCVQAAAKSLMIQQLFSAWNWFVNEILI